MTITKLTPEQARWVGARIADALGYVRQIMDQLRALVRTALDAIRRFVESWNRSPYAAAAAGPSRPAWMSPYGPPARRRRH